MKHPESIVLHTGYRNDETTKAVTVPIFQTAAYVFDSTAHAADVFALRRDGNTYTRIMNPTSDVLEQRMAAVEGGAAAISVASGQAAISLAIMNICHAGDNIVSSTDLYGGTWNLLANTFKRFGIETRFVSPSRPANFAEATDARTRCYFGESLPNPKLIPFPIKEVADIGGKLGVPLIVDNTMVPLVCRPIDHGAAIIVYSATKYIGGHGTSIGGVIIDSGKFPWQGNDRFPMMTQPDCSHGGVIWTEVVHGLESALGASPYILKLRMTLLRDLGPCISPFNAFLLLQGLETLPLRMRAHCENAWAVAQMLAEHPYVERVTYPGLMQGDGAKHVERYLAGGFGPMVQFEILGGIEAGCRFIESLKMVYHAANIGDARSLAIHPASTTHAQLPREERLAAGVSDTTIRLSVGIEHIADIIEDLCAALEASQQPLGADLKTEGEFVALS
jgi:O-acetylhomoserine (thiol)-lyase